MAFQCKRVSYSLVLLLLTLLSSESDSNSVNDTVGKVRNTTESEFHHEIGFSIPKYSTSASTTSTTSKTSRGDNRNKLWSPHSTVSALSEESDEDPGESKPSSEGPKEDHEKKGGPVHKFQVISSIRHFRSRKNFVRTRKPIPENKLQSVKASAVDAREEEEQGDQPQASSDAKHARESSGSSSNSYGIVLKEKVHEDGQNNGSSRGGDGEKAYGIPYFISPTTRNLNEPTISQKTDKLLLTNSALLNVSKVNGKGDSTPSTINPTFKNNQEGTLHFSLSHPTLQPSSSSFTKTNSDEDVATSVKERQQQASKKPRSGKKVRERGKTRPTQPYPYTDELLGSTSTYTFSTSTPASFDKGRMESELPRGAFRKVKERFSLQNHDDLKRAKSRYAGQKVEDKNKNDDGGILGPQNMSNDQTNPSDDFNMADGELGGEEGPEYFPGVPIEGSNPHGEEEEGQANLEAGDEYESLDFITSSSGSSSQIGKPDSDVMTDFLRIVESQHTLGANCTAGTDVNLGPGVVNRYAQERFRLEAELTTNRANMLTRFWKYANPKSLEDEYLLHAMIISLIEFDEDIFAAGNCYDSYQYKNYDLFCPYGYREKDGIILVKDLSREYPYLGNTSEWFYNARKDAERIIKEYTQFSRGSHSFRKNGSLEEEILSVRYEDGKWTKPYYDCGGGNLWMITFTIPFFGYENGTYFFKGTSGIDIDLRRVDIDQCPSIDESSEKENIFAGSDKCKKATTKCVSIKGLGFRRGSYRCECKNGFFFPNVTSTFKHFNGTLLEEEYEKKLTGNGTSMYDVDGAYECLPCPFGCDICVDDRPCVVSLNWLMRTAILILQSAIIAMLPIVGLFTWKYSNVKVVRAASPVLLRFIVLGAFFIYCTILVMYPSPNIITCTLRVWLREIGFSLAYGALMLKTWRISVIFRVRSAKAVKITDMDLMKRLGAIVVVFAALLVIRTLVQPPVAIISYTADELKAWLCKTDWWDHSFTGLELLLLVWGIRLCIVVRKAPSEFNESKFISLAIYNEFLLSLFLNISMLFLQSPANPDLLYIIFFCHVQLTMTLLLCLIFGSKAYIVFRGLGKGGNEELRVPTSKFISKSRSGHTPKQTSAHNSTGGLQSSTTSATQDPNHPNFNPKLSEDVQEEFRRLYFQLEELKERNLRMGNRHLVAKIAAMQEAADNILCTSAQINGQQTGTGSSPNTKSKSGLLSDISEEENPSQPQSTVQTPKPGATGTQPEKPRFFSSEEKIAESVEKTHRSTSAFIEDGQPGDGNHEKSQTKEMDGVSEEKKAEKVQFKELELQDTNLDDLDSEEEEEKENTLDFAETSSIHSIKDACCEDIPMQNLRKRKHKQGTTHTNPSSETGPNTSEIGKEEGGEEKAQNHRGTKLVLDLDDKSRFTEEITV